MQQPQQGWTHPLRYKFYMQVVISLTILGIGCYLILESEENSTRFTVGVSLISSICGYWFPSPTLSRRNILAENGNVVGNRNLEFDDDDDDSDTV